MSDEQKLGPWRPCLDTWISCAPFERLLGMDIREAKGGRSLLTMPFTEQLAMGAGLMHGGALVSLADTAVAMAIKSLLPEGSHFVTMELSARFLRPVRQGMVRAKAETEYVNERDIRGVCHIYDDAEEKVFFFEALFRIPRPNS